MNLLKELLNELVRLFKDRRRVRLTVHRAFFSDGRECFFVSATNLSHSREVEITHVWFETSQRVHLLLPERPLPKRLKPDERWDVWIDVKQIPASVRHKAYTLARARLSTDRVVKSVRAVDVPDAGMVAGGPVVHA